MPKKRQHKRYTKRLETEFRFGNMTFRGISSDLSEQGLFIRTQHGFVPGTTINVRLQLPDGTTSEIEGKVRRTIKTNLKCVKNGMGVEILRSDSSYDRFIRKELIDVSSDTMDDSLKDKADERDGSAGNEFVILSCSSCGIKNKIKTIH